jgi:hypothetical protein
MEGPTSKKTKEPTKTAKPQGEHHVPKLPESGMHHGTSVEVTTHPSTIPAQRRYFLKPE